MLSVIKCNENLMDYRFLQTRKIKKNVKLKKSSYNGPTRPHHLHSCVVILFVDENPHTRGKWGRGETG